jgi:sulfide:quinone oxidoreductase
MPYKCPAAPYEAAFLIDDVLRKRGLRESSAIDIVTVEPQPMPVAGPLIGSAIVEMLTSRGIGFSPGTKLTAVSQGEALATFDGLADKPFELAIAVPPHSAPSAVAKSGMCDETGWVPADAGTMATAYGRVYAIGDVTSIKLPNGKFLPKAGVFAHYEAETVAANIAAAVRGEEPTHVFDGHGECFLEIGRGRAGYASGQFYAQPSPKVRMRRPSVWNHWAKIWFEKYWWRRWL